MLEPEDTPAQRAQPKAANPKSSPIRFTREIALIGLIVLLPLIFTVLYPVTFRPHFWTPDNFAAILRNLAFESMLATGMTLLLVGGVFDLSVGTMAAMAGVLTGYFMKVQGWPVPVAVLAGLGCAALGGLLNGIIVAKVRVNALITTLATMGVFKGVAMLVGGPGITFLPESFSRVGQGSLLGLQSPVWIALVLALAAHYALRHTRFFRQYYYIGNNAKAAHLSGIDVERMQVWAFAIMGLIAGLAGIVYASRIATASATVGDGAELKAITAVILGGASLQGGRGSIWGTLLGVFFVALLKNVLLIVNVRPEWQDIALGGVLVLAVALDSFMNRRRGT